MPHQAILRDFLQGLENGDFTLTDVANATGLPLTTVAEMKRETYGSKLQGQLGKIEKIGKAMKQLRARKAPMRRQRRKEGAAA